MRRKASFIPLAFLFIGLCLSCTSKDQFMQGRVTDSVFSIDELTFRPMGDSFTLTYSAESNWTISAPSWVHVSPSSGRPGTYEITVMAAINDSWADRSGEIEVDFHRIQVNQPCPYLRVSYEAMSDSTITVSNIPVTGPGVNEGTVTAVYAWNHSDQARRRPLRVNVDSNVPWEMIFEEGSELTFFKVDTLNKGTHPFNPKSEPSRVSFDLMATKNNFQNADMETGFLIRPSLVEGQTRQSLDNAIASYQFDLHQNHLRFLIDGIPDTATAVFDELGYVLNESGSIIPDVFQKSFMVDCEIPWEVLFLDAEGNPFGSNFVWSNIQQGQEDVLQLEISEIPNRCNPSEEQREMIVRLSASDGDATRDIHVIQRPYIFEIDKDGWADTEFDNGELDTGSGPRVHEIPLRTSGSWTVEVLSSDPAWLRVDPNTSGGEASPGKPIEKNIKFWAYSQNLHLKNQAVSYLRFRAQNDQIKDIPITQAPFLLRADYDPDDLNNISATRVNERKELRLTTSNSWKLTQTNGSPLVDSGWYTVDVKQGAGAATNRLIRVGAASQNTSETSPRSFTMLLTSDLHEAMSSTEKSKWGYSPVRISIRQRPFTFKVNGKAAGVSNVMTIHAYEPSFSDYLDVDCDAEWKITEYPAWIKPKYISSDTDQDVLLQPDLNLVKSDRTGQVKVQCTWGGNTRVITVNIKQEALVFEVSRVDSKSMTDLDPDINFQDGDRLHKPTSFDFRVVATDKLPWRLSSTLSSFVPSISSMTGSQTVSVSPTYNANLNNGRTATISITLDRSADSRITAADVSRYSSEYNWTVTQKKYEFETGDVSMTAAFRALGDLRDGKEDYFIHCSGPWEVSSKPSWIHLRYENREITGGKSDPTFELVPDPNLSLYARESSRVTIRSKIGGYTKNIPISQDAYQYGITSGRSIQFETVSPTAATIKFRSSGDWELQGASDWGFSQTSGKGNDNGQVFSVTVNPGDYLDINADRRGTVKLVSSYGGLSFSTEEISLSQPKYRFSVNTPSVSFFSPFQRECATQAVSVTCTGDWTATANNDWVKITNGSGKGNGTFSIGVANDNLTTSELNAAVTVTTTYKGTKVSETTIPVAQSAYLFSLGKTSHEFSNSGGSTDISISCSGDWVVTKTKDDDDMIASFTPSGKKNGTIRITANANSGKSAKDKTATLQVKCENSNNLVQTITLTQKK